MWFNTHQSNKIEPACMFMCDTSKLVNLTAHSFRGIRSLFMNIEFYQINECQQYVTAKLIKSLFSEKHIHKFTVNDSITQHRNINF